MKHVFAMLLLGAGFSGYGQELGCGHPHACNYDADVIHDSELCWYTCNVGCTNPLSCAYSEQNLYHDGSCGDVEGCGIFVQCGIPYCEPFYESLDYDGDGWPDVPLLGCTDCTAANFAYCATEDDGSCYPVVLGCTLPFACNFNEEANRFEYGSCDFWSCFEGCTDETACNYDSEVLSDDGSCYFPEEGCDCDSDCCCPGDCNYPACLSDDNDGVCDCLGVVGCVDPGACNYDPMATDPDGSCDYASCYGCTEEWACNYDANATVDDGSCVFVEDLGCEVCVNGEVIFLDADGDGCCDQKWNDFGCSDPSACNYSNPCGGSSWECYYPEPIWCDACECAITPYDCNGALLPGFDANDNGLVDCLETAGCLIGDACNFNSAATLDDASCEFESCLGCTDESSCNYDSEATSDDGSCYSCDIPASHCGEGTTWDTFTQTCVVSNPNDTDFDGCVGIADLLNLLSVFGTCAEPDLAEWTCGDPLEYQGYDYSTVLIGEQCWFAENLRAESYANGDEIASQLSESDWDEATAGAAAVYGDGDLTCYDYAPDLDACGPGQSLSTFGRVYNWHSVADERGVCPTGWQVPSDWDWSVMEQAIGMAPNEAESSGWRGTNEGSQLKSQIGWSSGNGTDNWSFNGLPAGHRHHSGNYFDAAGNAALFWTDTEFDTELAWFRILSHSESRIQRTPDFKTYGCSVRCIRGPQ